MFFENKLFKERVFVDFSLLNSEDFKKSDELRDERIEKLLSAFNKERNFHGKFLFEFIKKDTAREFYDISVIKGQKEGYKVSMKPYSMDGFVKTTLEKENFSDMEEYTENVKYGQRRQFYFIIITTYQ